MEVTTRRSVITRSIAVSTAALIGTALTPLAASAQDSTWTGPGNDYIEGANWAGGIPTNLATFTSTGSTSMTANGNASINQFLFDANAQAYTFTNSNIFTFNGIAGVGIDNQSGVTQNIFNSGAMTFNNASVIGGRVDISNFGTGAGSTLTFNGATALTNGLLISYGELAMANGSAVTATGTALMTFNDTSSADMLSFNLRGGNATATGAGGMGAQAFGAASNAVFNGASHADDSSISLFSGISLAQGGAGVGELGVAGSGGTSIVFNNDSHADRSQFTVSTGLAQAIGNTGGSGLMSPGSGAQAVTGAATVIFNGNSHADGANFFLAGGTGLATGGTGGAGTAVVGGEGGNTGAASGAAFLILLDNSHADGATITSNAGAALSVGGSGGAGGAANGGVGGSATASTSGSLIQLAGNSHANNATISLGVGPTQGVGGNGGDATGAGNGGNGGFGLAEAGPSLMSISGNASVSGSTITNQGGSAAAVGGNGGNGGAGTGTGGNGGLGTGHGGNATINIEGNATLGAGTTLTNQGGDAAATGGNGGQGGTGASAGGNGGGAQATGGIAFVNFAGNASAGSATITNTAGTAGIKTGSGGDGDVGNGGNGGFAEASGGDAIINFINNSTAGTATITNVRGTATTATPGGFGADGAGGGAGGLPAGGGATSGNAIINFNDNATAGGATIINGADLNFNDSATGGSAKITNNSLGTTSFNDTSSLGSGTVQNNAGGSTFFNDTASAGTGTITNALGGGVSFLDGSTSGSATINNANGGNVLYAGNSLAGTSVINNAGTLSFIGAADAVAARVVNGATGTVSIGLNALRIGSLSGAGTVNNNGNTIQVGYLDLNDTFSGVISGAGGLLKRGTGTLVLTGANTYTGQTVVFGGTLQVDGSLASGVAISAGTTLRGVGTIAGAIGNNGIINPGNAANPLGTLVVTPSVTFNNGSVLASTISSGGQSSLLQAGSLFLNAGSTVRPTALTGGLFLMQTDYKIAVGSAGRNGTFTGVDESLLPSFLDASLFYTPTEVFLRVRRNATNFAQTANLTPNQNALSTALDAAVTAADPDVYGTYLTTYNTLLALGTNGPLQAALDTLSGDALTVVPVALQDQASRFAHRLDAYTWSNSSNVWGLIAYGDQDADSDGNGPGFNADALEFQIGFNTSLGANTRLGISAGYNDGDLDSSDRLVSADIETWSLGAQLRHDFGPVYASGQFTYSWHSVDTSRGLLLGGLANADFDATTWTAGAEIGGVFRTGQLSIEPHVSLRYANTEQDAYSESGPVGVLNVVAADYETTRLGLGVRIANREPTAPVRFYALLRYEHELGDEQSVLDNTLPGLPTFRVLGTRLGDDIVTADVGVEFQVSQGLSLFASGGGHTRSNETSLNANAGLRIRF